MKGQATLEFLLVSGATLVLLSLLAASLAAEESLLRDRAEELGAVTKAEAAARAVECMLNGGGGMEFDFRREGVYHSVENGHFHASCDDRMIEIGGVFRDDRSEPV